jgi:hypothetical protein
VPLIHHQCNQNMTDSYDVEEEGWSPNNDSPFTAYSPSSPSYAETTAETSTPTVETSTPTETSVETTEMVPSLGIHLNTMGSSLHDIWKTYGHRYPSISDMLIHAVKDTDIGIVLYPKKSSLSDDVWSVKEYLRSFGASRTSLAMIRARFPLITDPQWKTIQQQPEFVLDRCGYVHTLGLKGIENRRHNNTSKRRNITRHQQASQKHRRTTSEYMPSLNTIRRLLSTQSSPIGTSEIARETNLSPTIVSKCLKTLLDGRHPSIYEFVNGSIRTYGTTKDEYKS